ncbi:TRAP dicarboxylate transporter, DctM subunit [Caldalkalibacillus thermarum TA2.A1]|uniref:TRAP dicarboxylate transporter, DctM subunit n=1 Tax=Caldalkalibacillus thermarum (strain TA2.A1) TaxID=986075 RepID=F5L6A9_CALTT|nr:TRAP transporter large permease [Caldalkalibacillus thermarum]EGL83109.1 TRAP dicarboxylate transporter, DctM subunit [Caldalkalibacillus thermarum TA2.A1]QZT32476.1 TRAP transporter large permease [Caldalkalibacillus thermarum TA2.A1]
MGPEWIGVLGVLVLFVLILLRIPVGIALILVGFVGYAIITDFSVALAQLGTSPFGTASSYNLSVIPLFIFMGMILSNCGLGNDLFQAIDRWLGHLRGGMAMATIGTSAIFSAISGSVNATTATIAKVTLPEMKKYNYKPSLSTACVAAGGTLGILIPPSVILVLYGVLTMEPIGALLIAGIIPGILQAALFMLTIYLLIKRDPTLAPVREKAPLREKIQSLGQIWPFLLLFCISIGGIYYGVFTPTEGGAVGAMGALIFALLTRRLNGKKLMLSLDESVRLTAMIFLILIGANLFSQFLSVSRLPVQITSYVTQLDLSPFVILLLILFIYFILGLFIEGIAIFVLTLPIVYPLIIHLGYDGIWFGVIMVMVLNIGLITPPLGISVYIISGVAKDVPIETIFRGAIPMVATMIVCTLILTIFPEIVTFLPDMMRKN